MLVWPVVGAHFIQVACSVEESRCGISALSECVASLLLAESNGMCFNQMLLAPFQAIVCSDSCSPETREQLVSSISDYVRTKSDTLGSGWKPLFGTLRAVRTATLEDASVHWTVLDVIGTYLGIKKSCVLSWSLPDCFPCIVHFLQSTDTDAKELDDQLSEAALRIVQPTYAVILNLYRTPHIPNHNLLHRPDLRSYSIEEVEARVACLDPTESLVSPLSSIIDPTFYAHNADDPSPIELDADLDVSLGPLPWSDREAHETSAIELILSFVEQLCGTLVTAPPLVQPPLLRTIHQLLTTIKDSEFGHDTAAFCVSALLLPYIQKWLRRLGETDDGRNIKQAVGTCTQIVLEFVEGCETSAWSTRLLSDACRLAVECTAQPKDLSRVGAACLRHLATAAPHFEEPQWTILQKAMWDACTVTLHPIRILTSFYLSDFSDEKGDLGHVLIDSEGDLPPMQRILAQQVFLLDSQREESEMELGEGSPAGRVDLVLMKDGAKHRIPLPLVVSSLLAHQLILQLLGSLLSPKVVPPEMSRILATAAPIEVLDKVSTRTRAMLFYCLDASFQVSRDVDSRRGLTAILSKSSGISQPNLFKQLISAGMIKLNALFAVGRQEGHTSEMSHLEGCLRRVIGELRHIEQRTAAERMAAAAREHREEKLEFMLVEVDGEKLYKVVDETEVNNTITEYQKQRPLGAKPVKERKNPFMGSLSTEENNVIKTAKVDVNTLRLLSYRDICMMPIQLLLRDENRKQLLPTLIGSIKALILATPDLSVRNLAVELIEILAE